MNFKRSNTKSENSFSKDLTGQPASKTEKSQSQRNMLQSKSFSAKGSRTPGSFNNSRDNSFKKKDQPQKNLARSVIKQNPTGSIKDWNDLTNSSDLQDTTPQDIDLSEVPEEKVVEYEAHFPVLGGSGETPKSEGTHIKDVLKSSYIVKVLSMKDSSTSSPTRSEKSHTSEGFHIGKELQHVNFESELTGFYQNLLDGEASLAEKVQAGEGKEIYEESLTTQTNTENNALEDPLHIPNDEIRSDALGKSESDLLRTPLNSEVEESEPLFVRIPLELTLTEYQEDLDRVKTPTYREAKLRYQANLFSMVCCQTNAFWQPDNFTEAMQIVLSPVKEKTEQEVAVTPTFVEEKLASELEKEVVQEIIKEDNKEVSKGEEQKMKAVTEETPTLAEEKLASEIEQEELVREIIIEQNKEVFKGEEQKVKATGIASPNIEEKLATELEQNILQEDKEVFDKNLEGVVPSTQPEKLESELEQEELVDEIKNRNIETTYFGDVQKAKQDAMMNDVTLIQSISQVAPDTFVERPVGTSASTAEVERVFERKVGEIEFERTRQVEEKPLMKRRAVVPEPELEQVEENIVVSEEPVTHLTPIKENKNNLKKSDASLMDPSKMSLEHLAEESPLNATRSTDAALSVQRIDVIKEEAAEVLYSESNILFKEIDKNLQQVQDYKRKEMYQPAINLLKKSLATLEAQRTKEEFSVKEMNRALIECMTELADCFALIQDYKSSVSFATDAHNIDLTNLKAIYYLGAGLKKIGRPIEAYETLKDVRKLKGTAAEKNEFYGLAMFELEHLEKEVQVEAKAQNPHVSKPEQRLEGVREELEDLSERNKPNKKKEGSSWMSLGMAIAIGTASGLASWFVGKGYTKIPQRKVSVYSIGIGVLVGGVALAAKGMGKKN